MLREYIETQYKTNKETREKLEKQIHALQGERRAAEEALKELQKDQNMEKSIFSPRSQYGGTPEKLAEIRAELIETEKKLEAADTKQQTAEKEEHELEQVLAEVLELQCAADGRMATVMEDNDEELKKASVTVESVDPAVMPEKSDDTERESKSEIVKISETTSKKNDGYDKVETDSITIQQGKIAVAVKSGAGEIADNTGEIAVTLEKEENVEEKQKQTPDMERLNDLLSDLYRKAEFCTAFLYRDKNKCRNLLKEMKKELKKYAEEIAGM